MSERQTRTDTHRHTHTHRHTDTDRQTDRQTHTHTHTQTHTHTLDRFIACSAETDMVEIKEAFMERYDKTLAKMIKVRV